MKNLPQKPLLSTYIICLGIAITILSTGCKNSQIASKKQALQIALDEITADSTLPGLTFSVHFGSGEHIDLASGVSDREIGTAMTAKDRMFSGSIGKTYLVPLIFELEDAGKISLEDRVVDYFEESWYIRIANHDSITINMLLNHTSGIPRYVFKQAVWQALAADPNKIWTGEERLSYIFDDPPLHPAGKDFAYSDTNYILLGMLIEKLNERSYYDLVQEKIIKTLGLKETIPSLQRKTEGLIPGYTSLSQQFSLPEQVTVDNQYAFHPQMEWTGGGMINTSSDLAKWAKILYGGTFLSNENMQRMQTPSSFNTGLPEGAGYGFATMVWEKNGMKFLGHSGFMPGYVSIICYLPEHDVSMAMQVNIDRLPQGESLTGYMDQMAQIAIGPK